MSSMKHYQESYVTISNKTLVRIILFMFGSIVAIKFISQVVHPLTLIVVSLFLAMALNPFVNLVRQKLRIKGRGSATAISYLIVLLVLGAFFALILPPFISQTVEFIRDVPGHLRSLDSQSGWLGDVVRKYHLSDQLNNFAKDFANNFNVSNVGTTAITLANRILSNVISIITVLILTFMMLAEGPKAFSWFISQFPERRGKRLQTLILRMYNVVRGFVSGQALVALAGAFFSFVVLTIASSILNAEVNALALAALVFIFGLIPTIGSYINAAIITLVSVFSSPTLAVIMLVYYVVYQQIENATIQPYVQSKTNELSPLTIFIAALLGLGFGGILGGLVAIPIAGCVKILLEDWLDDGEYNASTLSNVKSIAASDSKQNK